MAAEDCLVTIIPKDKKLLYFEIGVLKASNLVALADRFPLLSIVGVDSYAGYVDSIHGYAVSKKLSAHHKHVAEQKIQQGNYKDRVSLLIEDSTSVAKKLEDSSIDIVFLDKGFSEDITVADILDWYPKVVDGGILCGHDAYTKEVMAGVQKGLSHYGIDTVSVIDDEVWWIKKLDATGS